MISKTGVLLLQMGGPNSLAEVESFLYNLFRDKYIIQLPKFLSPFQEDFASFVSSRRAPKVAKLYEEIGGKSPILAETQAQAQALEQRLGEGFKTYIAMRYSSPFLKDTYQKIIRDNMTELYVIPLYPQYSTATSGSSMIECKELFEKEKFSPKVTYIESWHDNKFFIELISKRIQDALLKLNQNEAFVLFSAHGLPVKYIRDGDPYEKQIKDTVSLVVQKFSDSLGLKIYPELLQSSTQKLHYGISYQSRVGPIKWLEPSTDTMIRKIVKDGHKNLIVVPISFVGDHIETLSEINIEYRELAEDLGIENFLMTETPKSDPLLIEALASLIVLGR